MDRLGILSNQRRWERAMHAHALGDGPGDWQRVVDRRAAWDARETKAAASAFTSDDVNLTQSDSADFMRHLTRQSVVARITDFCMRVPFHAAVNSPFTARASFVPERNAIEAFGGSLQNYYLPTRKVGTIGVFTREALEAKGAEDSLAAAMTTVCSEAMDEKFLDPNISDAEGPGAITANAEEISATADPAASFRALLRNYRNVASTVLIAHPELAGALPLITVNGATPFPDAGALGGSIAGLPLFTSQSVPYDSNGSSVIMLDCSRVILALGGVSISKSEEADLELSDTIDSDGTGERVSLFQSHSVALKALLYCNWKSLDSGACRILTGADW